MPPHATMRKGSPFDARCARTAPIARGSDILVGMSDERRDEDRAPIKLEVQYKRLNTFFADYTRNISKGGTFIRTTRPLDIGTEFVFVLVLPEANGGGGARLELTGVVKWIVAEAEATEAQPAGMGIRFAFDDDQRQQRLELLVAELMQASLGTNLTSKLLGNS
jgi:type IV pilus assembly protein PilZ